MTAGYSGTPLAKKLGFKAGHTIWLINQPSHYIELFETLPDSKYVERKPKVADLVHAFFTLRKELKKALPRITGVLPSHGTLWVSWPKKSSSIESDLDRDWIRSYILEQGLVDVKVCAVDENWSGLKFVYRLKDR